MSTFFRNVDSRYEDPLEIPVGDGKSQIKSLKVRIAILEKVFYNTIVILVQLILIRHEQY